MSHHRKNLLSGTSTLVLVSLLGASAAYADATATLPTRDGNNAVVTGAQTMLGRQTNTGTVQAPVTGSTVTNGTPNGPNGAGTVPGSAFTTTANIIGSNATDNSQVQAIALSLATTAGNGGQPNGIAILGVQNNTGRAISTVTASTIASNLTANGGTVAENGNTISATTALNQGTNQSIGTVPQNFAPTNLNGTVAFNSGNGTAAANALQAAGGVIVSSAQTNGNSTFTNPDGTLNPNGAASSARLGDGTAAGADSITLTIAPQGGTFTGNPTLNSNSLTASFSGNAATNTIGALASDGTQAGATQIGVPLVVANTQSNNDATSGTGGQGAFNANSAVTATITNPGTLTGALAVSGNTISSSATGNDAYAGGGTATGGNVIALASGVGLLGTSQAQQNTIAGTTGTAPTANTEADITVFNAQQNNTGANQTLAASTTNALVSSTANSVNGSVAMTGNGITADVRGNRAYNAVLAGGTNMNGGPDTALIDGDIAVNSLQSNSGLTLNATNTGGSIQSTAAAGNGQTIAGTTPTAVGSVTVTANTIGASAYGNTVTDLVGGTSVTGATAALEADQLTNGVATGVLTSDRTTTGAATAAAGFAIDNVQANLVGTGGAVNSTNNGTVSLTAGNAGAALAANLSVSANNLLSTAVGNSGSSTMALGGNGTDGTPGGSAGVLNQQTSTAPVNAQLTGAGITLAAIAGGNGFNGANLSASNELERALGYGNSAANTLSDTTSVLTATPSAAADSTAQAAGTATATANGTLTLLSDQLDSAAVTANAVPGVTVTASTGSFTGGSVTALANVQVAAARGNAVTDALTLSGGSVTATGTAAVPAPAVASLLNLQTVNGAAITATSAPVNAQGAPGAFVTVTTQGINTPAGATTAVTASNNAQASVATGSDANNALTVAESQIAATSTGAFGSAADGTTSAAFALSNNQASTNGGTRNASTTGTGVAVNFGNAAMGVTNATVAVDANSFSAQATDNTAANALNINGGATSTGTSVAALPAPTVQGTAALKNRQDSVATVGANVGTANTAVAVTLSPLGAVVGSPLGVDATVFNATATGNNATSTLALVAGTETGAAQAGAGNRGAQDASATTTTNSLTYYNPNQTVQGIPVQTELPVGATQGQPVTTANNGAAGDLVLANYQTVGGSIAASSNGGVTIANPTNLTNSLVSVTNTAAQAVAKGNVAVDAVNATLTGTGSAAPAYALYSNQAGTSAVSADSVLGVAVPNTTATNILSNNNTAVASLNDATNTVTGYASSAFGSAYGSQGGAATASQVPVVGQPTVTMQQGTAPFQQGQYAGNPTTTTTFTTTTTTNPGGTSVADLALYNQQTATNLTGATAANITATAQTTIGQNAGRNIGLDGTSTLNVVGNTTVAQAQANIANNTITDTLNGVAGSTFAASEALLNNQSSTSNVSAQSSTGAGTPLASLTFTGNTVATSTAELLDNAATAMARGNVASNAATGGALSTASGNIALASLQTNGGAITAGGGMTLNYLGTASGTNASTVLANGNTSRAIAGGNTANNAVTAASGATYGATTLANGSAGIGAAGATTDYAGYRAAQTGSLNANAQYAALNAQVNTGAITATNTSNMLVTPLAQGTLNAQVTGNSISSTGYANLANNAVGMTALATGASTGSLTNYQNNTGNVTASVTSSAIGLRGALAAQTGTLGVNNNTISASATGNSATNVISALPTTSR